MAISHLQHLLLVLAALFFLPALCAVDFEYCDESGYNFGNISRVEYVSPAPSLVPPWDRFTFSITVSGSTSEGLYGGRVEVSLEGPGTNHPVKADNLSDIEAGTNFVFTITEVPYKSEWMRHYWYAVTLFDDYLFPPEIMCVAFNVTTTTAPTLVSA